MKVADLSQRPLSSKRIVFFLEFGIVQAVQGALYGYKELGWIIWGDLERNLCETLQGIMQNSAKFSVNEPIPPPS